MPTLKEKLDNVNIAAASVVAGLGVAALKWGGIANRGRLSQLFGSGSTPSWYDTCDVVGAGMIAAGAAKNKWGTAGLGALVMAAPRTLYFFSQQSLASYQPNQFGDDMKWVVIGAGAAATAGLIARGIAYLRS